MVKLIIMGNIKKITTTSPEETFNLAASLAKKADAGDIFALKGDLGTGKTIFAKGFAQGLKINEEITSPTFNLMEVYRGRLEFYHFDLYRIENENELDNLFFEEYWEGKGVSVIEWAERAGKRLPSHTITIRLLYIDDTKREIHIEYPDN